MKIKRLVSLAATLVFAVAAAFADQPSCCCKSERKDDKKNDPKAAVHCVPVHGMRICR